MIGAELFHTLIVDELNQSVSYGPNADGRWITIESWGDQEWDVLVAIVSHPRGAHEYELVRRRDRNTFVNRKVVYRIREKFRKQDGIPQEYAERVILTKGSTNGFRPHSELKVRLIPGRVVGAIGAGEPRAFDSMLQAMRRACAETFGASGLRDAVALLPDDTRRDTFEIRHPHGRWIPVRHVSSWMRAIHHGPARLSLDDFSAFVRRAECYRLTEYYDDYLKCHDARLSDIGKMWRTCYDSGDFDAAVGPKRDFMEIRLWNHPYCSDERARRTFALCWRALSEFFGTKEPRIEACEFEGLTGALRIRIAGEFDK